MDYKNGKIYKITDIAYTKMYIGSTTQPLSKRFSKHKSDYKLWKNGKCNKVTSYDLFDEFGVENCKIELIENYECNCKDELLKKEGEYIKNNDCINKVIIGRTKKEWCIDNKDKIKEKNKKYSELNKEKIANYQKEYKELNEKIIVEYKHNYYIENKDKRKNYLEANRDKINEKARLRRALKKAQKTEI